MYLDDNIQGYCISSYRIYETNKIKLIALHLATGDDLRWRKEGKVNPAKEHKPDFQFNDIKKSVYTEPLLHHGYGFDAFIILNK